ncbi:CPBP family intramembrane metalloprotease [Rhodobacteraceae bacterium M382]|nr:CPBP family intramembrane metalloprotease [Rhodobacteraceae bacterium M382]
MSGPSAYQPQEARIAALRGRAELWRTGVTLAVIAVTTVGLSLAFSAVIKQLTPPQWSSDLALGATPGALLVLLGSFGFSIIGVHLGVRLVQHRSVFDLIGPMGVFWRQFGRVLLYLLALTFVLGMLPPYSVGEPLVPNLPIDRWLALLPLSLAALLIQTGAEEILFRGFAQQSLAARFRSKWVFLLAPSLLFALGHYIPAQAGDNALLVAVWAGVFGLVAADLTARSGTLGPAIAMHFFNNTTAVLIVSTPGELSGLSLYLFPYELTDTQAVRPWLIVDLAIIGVSWLVARLAIRR